MLVKAARKAKRLVLYLAQRRVFVVFFTAIIAVGTLGVGQMVSAESTMATVASWGVQLLIWILEAYTALVGPLLLFVANFLIEVAAYNNFINAPAVKEGWVIVRDIANLLIVAILLIIAFGTMLGHEAFHWKKSLPRLIITAVFINFSKTIAGLLIDAGQVAMLTFVNGFAAAAGGNFVRALKLEEVGKALASTEQSTLALTLKVLITKLLGATTLTIALVVIVVFLLILIFRVVMLWILIIMAPLAWVLGALPEGPGHEYYADWWKKFTSHILVGPILAFFLWLSLATVGAGNSSLEITNNNPVTNQSALGQETKSLPGCISEVCNWEHLSSFIVAIVMLLAGLQYAQEMGVAGAGIAGGALDGIKRSAKAAAKFAAVTAPMAGLSWAERKQAAYGPLKGIRLNPVLMWKGIKEGFEDKKKKDEAEAAGHVVERAKKGGLGGAAALALGGSRDFVNEYMNGFLFNKGIKRIIKGKPENAKEFADKESAAADEAKDAEEMANRMTDTERQTLAARKLAKAADAGQRATLGNTGGTIDTTQANNKTVVEGYMAQLQTKEQGLRAEAQQLQEAGLTAEANQKKSDANALRGERQALERELAGGQVQMTAGTGLATEWTAQWNEKKSSLTHEHTDLSTTNAQRQANIATMETARTAAQQKVQATQVDAGDAQTQTELTAHRAKLYTEREALRAAGKFVDAAKLQPEIDAITKALALGGKFTLTPELSFTDAWKTKWQQAAATQESNIGNERKKMIITAPERADALARKASAEGQAKQYRAKKEEAEAWTPQAFHARLEAREHLAEESKKITTDNAEELQALARGAEKEHNPDKLIAVMRQAAKVGHLNEIMYAFRDSKGKKFSGDHIGLSNFTNEILVKHMGVSREMAYSHQQDLSQTAKSMGHWNFAEGMGYDGARWRQRGFDHQGNRKDNDDDGFGASREHQRGVYIEKEKVGIDKMLSYNRLSWGGEREDDLGRRTWGFDSSSMGLMRKGWGAIEFKAGRGQLQDNLVRYIVDNKEGGIGALARMIAGLSEKERRTPAKEGGKLIGDVLLKILPSAAPAQTNVDEYMQEIVRLAGRRS